MISDSLIRRNIPSIYYISIHRLSFAFYSLSIHMSQMSELFVPLGILWLYPLFLLPNSKYTIANLFNTVIFE